jgi:type VI secretion system secreted protein VgrG
MIVLKKNGEIIISGKDISVNGSGKINVKAAGTVELKGSKLITDK